MKLEIEQQLAQAILDYLATKPYAEVYRLVHAMQSLKEVEIPSAEES